ncbi:MULTISPECIES: [protein-PII] uridylyltransferase [Comamonadaceae]|uniref:[protein-PII] uridylyltransferase n=1 Tax=Comamonadaceae TaxID=80864 RepID=UPI0025C1C138|nr:MULTISPECIES: [protein-PII] uridylyltransferase [Comamonadaceae]MDO8887178.1 [protein-PII] uridylyltransferase [Hydrogenophaga sp.]MDO9503771.1 [protein-PII] uridylyltransferase [Hydrogenophaga sp.]MDP1885923.1 [protein-PII] uridylyltransferase [Polaromonas sp.]MDP2250740.1 [protein-PII] uridylyltransferase [Hydrogenophaga sp.]MDP2986695.1 [protein-PII] uridylyltransferase [Hydrogenophaga sp.]
MDPLLAPAGDIGALRQRYRDDKTALFALLRDQGASTRGVRQALQQLSRLTDQTLRELWGRAGFASGFSLIAVGGYGRGELFPYSDVDVLVLLPDGAQPDDDAELKKQLEAFIGACWDLGLEIGSSVRSVADCVEESAKDVTVQTSMLESRLICGSKNAFNRLVTQLGEAMDPKAFYVAKTLEMRQRHTKYENTPYSLEPNCKESPGGLRDLQIILWVSKAAGLGRSWDDLARKGLATPLEARQIKANEALLSLIRARLHLLANRREDRLVFDLQTAVAESFGFKAQVPAVITAGPPGAPHVAPTAKGTRRASEALMKRYYWAAKAVTQLNQILLLNIQERLQDDMAGVDRLRPLNARFFDKGGMLEVASDDLYVQQPHAILETFHIYQTTVGIKGFSARTLRALYNARPVMNAKFRADPVNRAQFLQILQEPEGITHALRMMNETSVLGRYLWVFRHIVGQMQHDLFHVYTVDQHILMVLRNVRRFFIAEHSHEYPFCSQLAAGWDKPWIFYIAAIFHDIAKGRGGDHSDLGARDVRTFCRQHGIEREDSKLIEFLVSEHLTMSRMAQKEDLSDPDVIAAFAKRVGNERYLTALYLLTVADIRGTSPKVWNAWKGKLLEDLYRYTLRALGGRAPDPGAVIEARKREALSMLALHALPHMAHKALWDTLDVSYFMRHQADEIAWHTRVLTRQIAQTATKAAGKAAPEGEAVPDRCIVRARLSPEGEGLQVLVYAPDQNDLFARICGYFDSSNFSILDARVHTTLTGHALDTFQVVAPSLSDHYRELIAMVENNLAQTIDECGPLPAPMKGRLSRRVKSFPVTPRVDLRPDEKAQRWLLSVSASDRAGLLYGISRVLARYDINVQLAKITTLGERVEDTFLICGAQLQMNKRQIEIETELLETLEG